MLLTLLMASHQLPEVSIYGAGFDTGRILDGVPVPVTSPLQDYDPRLFFGRRFTPKPQRLKCCFRFGHRNARQLVRLAFPLGCGQLVST